MGNKLLTLTVVRSRGIYGGQGYIAGESPIGLVTVNTAPSSRWVEVRNRLTKAPVAVVFSNPDGTYRVNDLDTSDTFDVIARDYTGTYNDVIVSRVKPHPY